MKTDKFSWAFTTQCNGQPRMQRMIQTELPLRKHQNTANINGRKDIANKKTNNL
jgi:hypothetical protein